VRVSVDTFTMALLANVSSSELSASRALAGRTAAHQNVLVPSNSSFVCYVSVAPRHRLVIR
jgi:hypothetical protein